MSEAELRNSLAIEIFSKCEKPLEYVTKLCIADAEDGELRGMAVREYDPDMIKTRYSQDLAKQLVPFIQAQKAEWERDTVIKELTHMDNSGLFDDSDEFHEYYIKRLAELSKEQGGNTM